MRWEHKSQARENKFSSAPVKKKQSSAIRAGGREVAVGDAVGRDELGQVTEGAGLHDDGSGGRGLGEGPGETPTIESGRQLQTC